jgi:hypothetical protein
MKKLLIFICFLAMSLITILSEPINVNAVSSSSSDDLVLISEETTYNYDTSYIKIKVYSSSLNLIKIYNTNRVYTKTGVSEVTRHESDGTIIWQYTLTGYFEINPGISCTCYNAIYSQYSNNSSWNFSNGAASCIDNAAYGQGTFKYKLLLITFQTVNIDVRVMCDINGNIS